MPADAIALQALGNPTRGEIFERLANRPLALTPLAGVSPVPPPAVSQLLRVPKDIALIAGQRAPGSL